MIITVIRTGGFTGIPFKKTIDTSTLPSKVRQELELLLRQAQDESELGMIQKTISEDKQIHRDSFTYSLSIQQAQNEIISKSITLPDHLLSPKMRILINKLQSM